MLNVVRNLLLMAIVCARSEDNSEGRSITRGI